jgi:tetratricopeptide (TPR) repeat protein
LHKSVIFGVGALRSRQIAFDPLALWGVVRYHKFMKEIITPRLLFVFALAALIAFMPDGTSVAQESPDQGFKRELEERKKSTPEKKKPVQQVSLDELFSRLKLEADAQKARFIERAIWNRWTQSGSETIDLLMNWSATAMKEKKWSAAFDLLDQVVVLAPHYAEGWNRRATLYFLRAQYGRSIHDIEQVLKLETRHFGAMAGLGNILQKLDNDKRALVMWKNVLEVYPANKNAQKSVKLLEEKLSGQGI